MGVVLLAAAAQPHDDDDGGWGLAELRAQLTMRGGDVARCGHLRTREQLVARVLEVIAAEPQAPPVVDQ